MFTIEEKKEFILSAKFRAKFEKIRAELIEKEIEDNKNNYSNEELKVLRKLLKDSIDSFNKDNETYIKGSVLFGLDEIKQRYNIK